MSLRIAVLLAAMPVAVVLLSACFGGGGSEANAPGTTSGATTSPAPSPTTTSPTTTSVATTDATATATVTGVTDVPTTTEVGTDVLPKSAPPWHKELSICNTQSFSVVYDRDLPAILVKRDDRVIAWAGLYRRDVSEGCSDVPRKRLRSASSAQPEGIYESLELRCQSPGKIQIDVRPVELHGAVNGSIVNVGVVGTANWLITAIVVNEVEGRRVYFKDRYCARP